MDTMVCYPEVTFKAILSQLVIAKTKKQALELAASDINKTNLHLERMRLENANGEFKDFLVTQVEQMDWYDVQNTEFSNSFRVFGRIGLSIRPANGSAAVRNEADVSGYFLPKSRVDHHPVLTLPVGRGHAFLTVIQQLKELKTPAGEASSMPKLA